MSSVHMPVTHQEFLHHFQQISADLAQVRLEAEKVHGKNFLLCTSQGQKPFAIALTNVAALRELEGTQDNIPCLPEIKQLREDLELSNHQIGELKKVISDLEDKNTQFRSVQSDLQKKIDLLNKENEAKIALIEELNVEVRKMSQMDPSLARFDQMMRDLDIGELVKSPMVSHRSKASLSCLEIANTSLVDINQRLHIQLKEKDAEIARLQAQVKQLTSESSQRVVSEDPSTHPSGRSPRSLDRLSSHLEDITPRNSSFGNDPLQSSGVSPEPTQPQHTPIKRMIRGGFRATEGRGIGQRTLITPSTRAALRNAFLGI